MGKMVRLPWVTISLMEMIRDVLDHGSVTLVVRRRPDVQTRRWYELSWTAADGEPRGAVGSDMQLVLRRAAEIEQAARMDSDWDDE